jgi:hypothetical protein
MMQNAHIFNGLSKKRPVIRTVLAGYSYGIGPVIRTVSGMIWVTFSNEFSTGRWGALGSETS